MRRSLPVVAAIVAAGAATAFAQGGADPYTLPEPKVTSAQVIKLPSAAKCVKSARVKVRLRPPAGAVFATFSISVAGKQVVSLTGIPRAASVTVALPKGRSSLVVRGTTLGGQTVRKARAYKTCGIKKKAKKKPKTPTGPLQEGGGED